jgi:uncharacterized protein (DUF4415 family)
MGKKKVIPLVVDTIRVDPTVMAKLKQKYGSKLDSVLRAYMKQLLRGD